MGYRPAVSVKTRGYWVSEGGQAQGNRPDDEGLALISAQRGTAEVRSPRESKRRHETARNTGYATQWQGRICSRIRGRPVLITRLDRLIIAAQIALA